MNKQNPIKEVNELKEGCGKKWKEGEYAEVPFTCGELFGFGGEDMVVYCDKCKEKFEGEE